MRKKKLLFIIENLRPGGAQKALVTLLSHLDCQKYRVTLCVLNSEGVYWDQIPPHVKVVVLFRMDSPFLHRTFRRYSKYGSTLLMSFQIKRKIGLSYDAIVSFLEGRSLLFHGLVRKRARKNITWVHCDLPQFHWTQTSFFDAADEMNCYAHMDRIVFVSEHAMNSFSAAFDIDVPRSCIYNLIDVKPIRPTEEPVSTQKRSITITAIGSLTPVKAFDRVVRVARMFKDVGYDCCFQIVGMGADELSLKQLCDELDVRDRVVFPGFLDNPTPTLQNSDMLVSTSLSEGLPLVICEAMCLGIPVVATRTAGAEELLGANEYGLIAEQNDRSIFEALKLLIDDPALRRHYAAKASDRADLFERDKVLSQIGMLFE